VQKFVKIDAKGLAQRQALNTLLFETCDRESSQPLIRQHAILSRYSWILATKYEKPVFLPSFLCYRWLSEKPSKQQKYTICKTKPLFLFSGSQTTSLRFQSIYYFYNSRWANTSISKCVQIMEHWRKQYCALWGCDHTIDAMDFLMIPSGYTTWKDKFLLYLFINTHKLEVLRSIMPG